MKLNELFSRDLKDFRSIPFWSWNDKLQPDELRRQIRAMNDAGIGGFFMHARGGLMTEYLSDEWFEATATCIDEARKLGMNAWCYDENGWPSGFAGMKLLEDPANWVHYITCETRSEFDSAALAVYALNGETLTRLRAGEHAAEYICIYDRTNSSVVDILNPDVVDKFIAETHARYYERFKSDFGNVMLGFFTDEPQYFRWDTAYTPIILDKYRELYGADILDELGALFIDCTQAPRLRYRYWKLMNRMFNDTFAGRIYAWCDAHGCQLTGHAVEERNMFWQLMCCGGIMPFYEYEHVPGIDWLGRDIATEEAPKQLGSVAQQLGKAHALTETFACAGWDVTPRELKRIAEWQYVHGVNLMCQHLYPYSIRGQRKRDYPAFYSPHNPWTSEFKAFNDYFTRLGCMLSQSREVADVAVIHPIHSAYFSFKRNEYDSTKALDDAFDALIERLGAANIGHHYIDETLLEKYGSVAGTELVLGECRYKYIVIPNMLGLDASTARLLKQYAANGGKFHAAGALPKYIEGEPGDLSFMQSNATFHELLPANGRISDLNTEIRSTVHVGEFGTFMFAVNLSETETYSVDYSFAAQGAKLFDAFTQTEHPAYFLPNDAGITLPLTFKPGQSYIVLLDDCARSVAMPVLPDEYAALPIAATVTHCSPNALTLDYAALSYDGINYSEPLPIMSVSDELLRGKTNRTVYLRYAFDIGEAPAVLKLECERMGAASVTLNGEPLGLANAGTLDPAFMAADIAARAKLGRNELVFTLDYYQPEEVYRVFNGVYYEHSDGTESLVNCLSYVTDIEAVYLLGEFGVSAPAFTPDAKHTLRTNGAFTITAPVKSLSMAELTERGYPFFAGEITFETSFNANGAERELKLSGRYHIAKVSVNGAPEQLLMFDDVVNVAGLVHSGENALRITLTSSNRNLYGPFHVANDPDPFGVSPDTFARYGRWENHAAPDYIDSYAFSHFGIDALLLR